MKLAIFLTVILIALPSMAKDYDNDFNFSQVYSQGNMNTNPVAQVASIGTPVYRAPVLPGDNWWRRFNDWLDLQIMYLQGDA